jgi:uncharacterized membrane protein YoaK (UPF0700 family)
VAATSAVLLLAATTLAALIGLSAECTGSTEDCPHSDTYRGVLLTVPVVAALLLVAGTAWSIRRRTLSPLALAEAATLAVAALVDAILNTPDIGTMVLLALAAGIGAAALRRATQPPRER